MPETKLPVLVLAYNRAEETRALINALRTYQPTKLYLACDGPKKNLEDDSQKVTEVRLILENEVDWPCEKRIHFNSKNLGLRVGVSEAITWFFQKEDQGVVLEDDCIPHTDFFRLCEFFLEEYKTDARVWGVTGNNNFRTYEPNRESFQFFQVPMIWGWASWSDRWVLVDHQLKHFEYSVNRNKEVWPSSEVFHALNWKLNEIKKGRLDSWAYIFAWSAARHGGLWGISNPNLVTNVGSGEFATNTLGVFRKEHEQLGEIIKPEKVGVDYRAQARLLRRTHLVMKPLWINLLRDLLRSIRRRMMPAQPEKIRSISNKPDQVQGVEE